MSYREIFDERMSDITNKIDLEKLKLLLELEISSEKHSSKCIDDLVEIIRQSRGKPLLIAVQNNGLIELFVYNNKVKIASISGKKPKGIGDIINALQNHCKITIYTAKLPTNKYLNEYVFGIDFMDKNHLEMFNIMDKLILAVIDGKFNEIRSLAEKLYAHTKDVHFKQEEDVMKSTNYNKYYPEDYKRHIEWHKDFLEALEELKKSAEKEKYVELIENLLIIFETYFDKYLKDTDAKLANYLKLVLTKK